MAVKPIRAIGDADSGDEDEGGAAIRHRTIVGVDLDEFPYLACQLSVFSRQACLDMPQGSRFVGRISLGLEPMVQGTQSFRQV